MKIFSIFKRHILPICVFAVAIGFSYSNLPRTFFQQDEWWGFGQYIEREQAGGFQKILTDSLFMAGKVHMNPFTEIGMYLQLKLFGMNFPGYAYVSLGIHFLNTVLIYLLMLRLIRNKTISVLAAALFAVNSISHQAVTWVSGSIQTESALLFTLTFSLLFDTYLRQKQKRQLVLYLALFCIVIALLFKETVLPFILFIFFLRAYAQNKKYIVSRAIVFPGAVVFVVYGFLRAISFFLAPTVVAGVRDPLTQPGFMVYMFRLIALPFRVITQSIFPQLFLLNVSKGIIEFAYPHFILSDGSPNPYIAESIVFDLLSLMLGSIFFLILFAVWRTLDKHGQKDLARGVVFAVVAMIGGALAIIFIPGRPGFVSIIEPRHMYIGMFGTTMYIVLVVYTAFRYILKLSFWRGALMVVMLGLIAIHMRIVQSDLKQLVGISTLRKSFLMMVGKDYPTLPREVVFYTQSDRSYYGMAEDVKILPLQSGFGRMLMVWYRDKEEFPGCLYEKAFLHGIKEEGYRNCGGRGIGYFRQYDTLLAALRDHKLSLDAVIAYNWNSKKGQFTDMTRDIRTKLANDLLYEPQK